ncbi:MAG: ribonuclease H, partial [Desulfobacterales bacterium]
DYVEKKLEADDIEWKRKRFKKNKVWLAVDRSGRPLEQNGKVLIKYQLDQTHEYWVRKDNVYPLDSKPPETLPHPHKLPVDEGIDPAGIQIFTDGASAGNPGPSGIGVLLRFGNHEKEISEYIGTATNNIAELKAIQAGLQALKNTTLPVRIYTDSRYAYGVLVLGWKAKANNELIESIKKTMRKFIDIRIFKVKGHAGHQENERADFLATSAIKQHTAK